jgi:hypothetical protein
MFRLLYKFFLPTIIKRMEMTQFRSQLIIRMNEHVDIPVFNEESEEQIFTAIYDILLSLLKTL